MKVNRFSAANLIVFALIFAGVGSYFLFFTHAATLAGDINVDGVVNITDLSILLSSYASPNSACVTASQYTCDLNGSGGVTIIDLSILLSNYGKSAPTGNVTPVLASSCSTNCTSVSITWPAQSGATSFKGAYSDAATGGDVTYFNSVTSPWNLTPAPGQTLYYAVASEGPAGELWSDRVAVAWGDSSVGKLRVSVNNSDGWGAALTSGGYVSNLFTNIGVTWNRFDVGEGGDMSIVNDAKSKNSAMNTLIMYTQGSDGNCNGLSASQVSSDINALIPQLKSYGATELEFCNESYITMNAKQYAVLYDAAHKLTKPAGITLLAVSGTQVANQQNGGSGNWFQDLASTLPGGAAEVDAFTDHPYPASGDSYTYVGGGFYPVWGLIDNMHQQSIDAGFSSNLPWYFTETGSGMAFYNITEQQQADDLIYMLNQVVANYPWVAYFNWYAAIDDSETPPGTENFGLLGGGNGTGSITSPTKRPSFNALQNWMSSHTDQTNG